MAEGSQVRLVLRRLVHAVEDYGLRGSLARGLRHLLRGIRLNPPAPATDGPPHPFDRLHAVDTGGYMPGEALPSGLGRGRAVALAEFHSTAYYAISPSTLAHALSLLPEPANAYTFVDLGCGKGRALLVAVCAGFGQAVGVELSPELCATARENSARLRLQARVRVEHGDAAAFTYPSTPLVVFLYHPFLRPLLRRVLQGLERQLRQAPRPMYLLYANPGYQRTLRQFRWLKEVWDFSIPLSAEDAAADRHGITHERYTLYRSTLSPKP